MSTLPATTKRVTTPTEPEEGSVAAMVTIPADLLDVSHREFRDRWNDLGEKLYLETQLRRHAGNVSKVSREIDLARTYTHKLIKKHGLFRRA